MIPVIYHKDILRIRILIYALRCKEWVCADVRFVSVTCEHYCRNQNVLFFLLSTSRSVRNQGCHRAACPRKSHNPAEDCSHFHTASDRSFPILCELCESRAVLWGNVKPVSGNIFSPAGIAERTKKSSAEWVSLVSKLGTRSLTIVSHLTGSTNLS